MSTDSTVIKSRRARRRPCNMEDADKAANTDRVFHVGDENYKLTVKVEKDLLAGHSSVFEKMFDGTFPQEEAIEITDVSPEAFIILLKFLRNEPYSFWSKELAVEVMHAAEKYELLELKHKCELFLLPRTIPDVWWVAPHAYRYNSALLRQAIRDLMSKRTSAFIFDKNFLTADEELVLEVARLDSVTDVTELDMFRAVTDWARHQIAGEGAASCDVEKLRQKLANVLKLLRLQTICPADRPALQQLVKSLGVRDVSELCSSRRDSECKGGEGDGEVSAVEEVAPRTVTPAQPEERGCLVEVVACSPADVKLCFWKRRLQQEVTLVQAADLVSIVVPGKLALGDFRRSYYCEDLHVFVTCAGHPVRGVANIASIKYGSGCFKGVVRYGQEINIPIVRCSAETMTFMVSDSQPLIYTLKFYFSGQGFYPYQLGRSFSACRILGNRSAGASYIVGYKFLIR